MINIQANGYNHEILTRDDVYIEVLNNFKSVFSTYLTEEYGISEEEFRQLIKDKYPEKFV